MRLNVLHLDDALRQQTPFMRACERGGVRQFEAEQLGRRVRLWGKQKHLDALQKMLRAHFADASDEPQLSFMGSGDFHHVTGLLLDVLLEKHAGPITVIHFDNHPDWVKFDGGMHCGSWVTRAAQHPKIAKIITVGVCSNDLRKPEWKGASLSLLAEGKLELFPYHHAPSTVRKDYGSGASHRQSDNQIHWQTIAQMGEDGFADTLLSRIGTQQVYITIDKDVLSRDDAETNWDQGMMRLPFLLRLLRDIAAQHRIIGADVNGDYSAPRYSGSSWTRLKKHAEILLDQPRHCRCHASAQALNSNTNHALLEVLSEAMA